MVEIGLVTTISYRLSLFSSCFSSFFLQFFGCWWWWPLLFVSFPIRLWSYVTKPTGVSSLLMHMINRWQVPTTNGSSSLSSNAWYFRDLTRPLVGNKPRGCLDPTGPDCVGWLMWPRQQGVTSGVYRSQSFAVAFSKAATACVSGLC